MKKIYKLFALAVLLCCGTNLWATTPFTEGFESAVPPTGWSTIHVKGDNWSKNNNAYYVSIHGGSYDAMMAYASSGADNYLITPQLSPVAGETLEFYLASQAYTGTTVTVEVSEAGNADVADFTTVLATYKSNVDINTTWGDAKVLSLSSYAGKNIYIAFHVVDNNGGNIYLDDVSVKAPVTCPKPTALEYSELSSSSVKLSWTKGGSETAWNVLYKAGSADWATQAATTNPFVLTISPATSYQIKVQADCGGGDKSEESNTISFDSPCEAIAPVGYAEGFEDFEKGSYAASGLTCWEELNATHTDSYTYPQLYVNNSSDYVKTDSKSLYLISSSSSYEYAILPPFNASLSGLQVLFSHKEENVSKSGYVTLGYMTNVADASTFVVVQQCTRTTGWQDEEITLPTIPDGARLAFRYGGGSSNYYAGIDDIKIQAAASCAKPTAVAAASYTNTSASITWTDGGEETSWKLQYSTDNTNWTAANEGYAFTTKPYPLAGLEANTKYYVQVKAVCGVSDESDWSASGDFTTDCNAVDELSEAFSSTLPDCWRVSKTGGDYSWTPYSSQYHSSSYSMQYYATAATTEYSDLVTPNVNLGDKESNLTFYLKNDGWSGAVTAEVYIVVGSTPTKLKLADLAATSGWALQTIALTDYVGQTAKFVFRAHGLGAASSIYIDDVAIEVQPCATPTGLKAAASKGSATITWTDEEADKWNLRYRVVKAEEPYNEWIDSLNLTAKSKVLTGLNEESEYEVQVQAVCSATRSSDWTASVKFTPACPTPGAISLSNKTYKSVTVSWTAGGAETAWNLQYKIGTDWIAVAENPLSTTSYAFNALETGTPYAFRVQASCEGGWTDVEEYTPQYTAPVADAATAITDKGATFTWSAVTDATKYEYAIVKRHVAVSAWTEVAEATKTVDNLDAATEYDFFVRAKYADEGVSTADSIGFATITIAPKNLQQVGETTTTTASFSWEANGAATQYQWSTDNTNWSELQAELTATVEDLTPGTTYTFYVRSYYAVNVYSAATTLPFDTQCATETLPFAQQFNSTSKPNCWTADNWGSSANNWTIDEYTNHSGETSYAASYNAKASTSYSAALITPEIKLSDVAILEFYYQNRYMYYSYTYAVNFDVVILDASDDSVLRTKSYTEYSANNAWASDTIDLSAFVNDTVKIKFVGKGVGTYYTAYLKLDDIAVNYKPVATPTNVEAVPADQSATITWDSEETGKWNLRYRPYNAQPEANWTIIPDLTEKSKEITDLTNGTTYEVQVLAVYSANRQSEWTASTTFIPQACASVTAISFGARTYNSIVVSWETSGAGTWNLDYKTSEDEDWTERHNLDVKTLKLTGLETGKEYTVQVDASCGETPYDTTFTLAYTEPVAAEAENISDTAATVQWLAVADASSYEYDFVIPGEAAAWKGTTELAAAANNLAAGIDYLFVVRSVYPTGYSDADTTEFTTVTIKPRDLHSAAATTSSVTISWSNDGAATQYQWKSSKEGSDWTLTSDTFAVADELESGTSYTFYVRSYYNANVHSDSIFDSFATACDTKALGWSEGFESSSLPACWDNSDYSYWSASNIWNVVSDEKKSGSRSIMIRSQQYSSSYTADLETPSIAITEEATLTYYWKSESGVPYKVIMKVNGVETELKSFSSSHTWTNQEVVAIPDTCVGKTISFIFRAQGAGNNYKRTLYIDDVAIIAKPCPAISTLTATATLDSVVLTWTSEADAFEYCVVPQGNDAAGWQAADAKTVTVKSLVPETAYTAYVRSSCSETKKGEPKSTNFTPACPAPTALTVGEVTTTTATLSWTAAAGITKYQYRFSNQEWSNDSVVEGTTLVLSGLTPGTSYSVQVRSYYSADAQSAAISKTFVTECAATELPFTEDFSGAITCWSLVDCYSYTGVTSGAFRFYFSSNPPQYLISPEFVPSDKNVKVMFQYKAESASNEESFQVGYSTTTKGIEAFTWSDTTFCSETEYQDYSKVLPAGIRYVAIKYTANDKYYLYIDAFRVEETSETTGIGNADAEGKAIKLIENNQLVIIHNGVRYNALGEKIQ